MFDCRKWFGVTLTLGFTAGLLLGLASSSLAKPPAPPPPQPTYEYTIELLPELYDGTGYSWSLGFAAMNNHGDVVGLAYGPADPITKIIPHVGFLCTHWNNAITDLDSLILDDPTCTKSFSDGALGRTIVSIAGANGINDSGQITGGLNALEADGVTLGDYAFRYTPASSTSMATLEVLGSVRDANNAITHRWSFGQAINNSGTVVGTAENRGSPPSTGFTWGAGTVIPETGNANAINDSAVVVGGAQGPVKRAYRYDPASNPIMRYYEPLGAVGISVVAFLDIDDDGNMVGITTTDTTVGKRAFKCLDRVNLVSLGTLDNTTNSESSATGVRTLSTGVTTIVGYSSLWVGGKRGAYEHRAFVYTEAKGMRDLFGLVDRNAAGYPVGLKAADLNSFPKINDLGQIAGTIAGSQYQGTSGLYSGRIWIVTPKP